MRGRRKVRPRIGGDGPSSARAHWAIGQKPPVASVHGRATVYRTCQKNAYIRQQTGFSERILDGRFA